MNESEFFQFKLDVQELKRQAELQRSDTEAAIRDSRRLAHEVRNELTTHFAEDARFEGTIATTLQGNEKMLEGIIEKLFGNGQPGEISKLHERIDKMVARIQSLENKTAMGIGGGIVIVYALDKLFK